MNSSVMEILKNSLIVYEDMHLEDSGSFYAKESLVKDYIINYEHDLYFIKKIDDDIEVFLPLTQDGSVIE